MYEQRFNAGLMEADQAEGLPGDHAVGTEETAGEEGRRGARGEAPSVSRRLEFGARLLQSEHGPFYCLMAGIATVLCLVLTVLFRLENISVINLHLGRFLLQCALPIGCAAAYCHWAKHSRLRDGSLMVLWACIFFNLLQLPQYAAARTGLQ